ncbi:hypothetical protein DESC_970021 [Desulfosarcina cetonica]|nr:hypothetical protein DESC_970021 [Desulfosarcina cetonica]
MLWNLSSSFFLHPFSCLNLDPQINIHFCYIGVWEEHDQCQGLNGKNVVIAIYYSFPTRVIKIVNATVANRNAARPARLIARSGGTRNPRTAITSAEGIMWNVFSGGESTIRGTGAQNPIPASMRYKIPQMNNQLIKQIIMSILQTMRYKIS